MAPVYAVILGPVIVAVVVAVLIWLRRGSDVGASPGRAFRVSTIVAAGVPLLVAGARQGLSIPLWMLRVPRVVAESLVASSFVWPIVLALAALVLLIVPLPVRRGKGAAEVSRRTMWSFAPLRLLFWLGVLLAIIVALTIAAGVASEPDEQGRYRMYWVRQGEAGAATEIYGWYQSVPALGLLAALVVLVLVLLGLIARPALALGGDRERDVAMRRLRSRNVLLVALGGAAGHLGTILHSLSSTSSVRAGFSAGSAGWVRLDTPFAALTAALTVAGACLLAVALTAWLSVLLSVIPVPRRIRATAFQS